MSLWWLSFADPEKPAGAQFLGVAIVEAADLPSAIKAAWALGCNPGGSVKGFPVDPTQHARLSTKLPVGRLLGPDEARDLDRRISAELDS